MKELQELKKRLREIAIKGDRDMFPTLTKIDSVINKEIDKIKLIK